MAKVIIKVVSMEAQVRIAAVMTVRNVLIVRGRDIGHVIVQNLDDRTQMKALVTNDSNLTFDLYK